MPLGAWKAAKATAAAMTIARVAVQLGNISLLSLFALAKTASSGHLTGSSREGRMKTLEVIQVKLYATPPAATSPSASPLLALR